MLIRVNQTPIARTFKISAIKVILQGLVSSAPNRHTYWAKLITNYRSEQSTIGGQFFYREHDFYPVLDQKTGNTSIVACNPQLGTGSGGGGGGGGGTYQSGQTYGSCIKYERVDGGATASKPALVVNQTRWGSADCGCEAGFTRIETGRASEMIQWEGYKIYYYACLKD